MRRVLLVLAIWLAGLCAAMAQTQPISLRAGPPILPEGESVEDPAAAVEKRAYNAAERIVLSADGSRLAMLDSANVRIWDVRRGEVLRVVELEARPTGVALNGDGSRLALGFGDGTARVWDMATGESLYVAAHAGSGENIPRSVVNLAFSADGSRLATSSEVSNMITLWDGETGARLRDLHLPADDKEEPILNWSGKEENLQLSFDGARLAARLYDGVVIWDAATGEILLHQRRFAGLRSWSLSGDGSRLAMNFSYSDYTSNTMIFSRGLRAQVWDVASGAVLPTSSLINVNASEYLALNADGSQLLSAPLGFLAFNDIRVWDLATGEILRSLPLMSPLGNDYAVNASGTHLAMRFSEGVRLLDLATGELLTILFLRGGIEGVAQSADGADLTTLTSDGTARIWSSTAGRLMQTADFPKNTSTQNIYELISGRPLVAFDAVDARLALTFGDGVYLLDKERTLISPASRVAASGRIASSSRGRGEGEGLDGPSQILISSFIRTEGGSSGVALSADGALLATISRDSKVDLWDVATGRLLKNFPEDEGWSTQYMSLSADGSRLATLSIYTLVLGFPGRVSVSSERRVRLWDVRSGKELRSWPAADGVLLKDLSLNEDGSLLAFGSAAGMKVWDEKSGAFLSLRDAGSSQPSGLALSADGRRLAASLRAALVSWICRQGRCCTVFHMDSQEIKPP